MPKTPPINEAKICARLREWRLRHHRGATATARAIGIPRETLAGYERASTPVKAGAALGLWRVFGLSPRWLATGEGSDYLPFEPFAWHVEGTDPRSNFSAVYENVLAPQFTDTLAALDSIQALYNEFAFTLLPKMEELGTPAKAVSELRRMIVNLGVGLEAVARSAASVAENKSSILSNIENLASSAPVIAQPGILIDALRQRLARATKPRGSQRALAKLFGVSPAAVSEWLSGASAPTADNTLRLLEWVSAVEANQKKPAPVLEAPTRRKAQARNQHVSETNSGPPRSSRKRA